MLDLVFQFNNSSYDVMRPMSFPRPLLPSQLTEQLIGWLLSCVPDFASIICLCKNWNAGVATPFGHSFCVVFQRRTDTACLGHQQTQLCRRRWVSIILRASYFTVIRSVFVRFCLRLFLRSFWLLTYNLWNNALNVTNRRRLSCFVFQASFRIELCFPAQTLENNLSL